MKHPLTAPASLVAVLAAGAIDAKDSDARSNVSNRVYVLCDTCHARFMAR
jgi:hypothetical protein